MSALAWRLTSPGAAWAHERDEADCMGAQPGGCASRAPLGGEAPPLQGDCMGL